MKKYFLKLTILFILLFFVTSSIKNYTSFGDTGKKYKFNNVLICIDPGHANKINPGTEQIAPRSKIRKAKDTIGTTGVYTKVPEYMFNLKLSFKVQTLLKKDGFKVIMTRNKNDVRLSNIERAQVANKSKANLFIRIHADGSNDKNMHGISILYPALNSNNKSICASSKLIAGTVLSSVITSTSAKSNGIVKRSDLTGFNWCRTSSILIESGFMSNISEDKKLESDKYEDVIAKGIVNGIESYFSKNKKDKR